VASDGGERIDGGRESMTAITASMTAVARFKRSEIQTHFFSTLEGIYWTAF